MFLLLFLCPEYQRQKSISNKLSDSEEIREVPLDLRAGGLGAILKTVKSLLTNGVYVFGVLYGTCDAIIIQGFISFGAKYFQQMFGLTPTLAGIVFGKFCVNQKRAYHEAVHVWTRQNLSSSSGK